MNLHERVIARANEDVAQLNEEDAEFIDDFLSEGYSLDEAMDLLRSLYNDE